MESKKQMIPMKHEKDAYIMGGVFKCSLHIKWLQTSIYFRYNFLREQNILLLFIIDHLTWHFFQVTLKLHNFLFFSFFFTIQSILWCKKKTYPILKCNLESGKTRFLNFLMKNFTKWWINYSFPKLCELSYTLKSKEIKYIKVWEHHRVNIDT